MSVCLFVCLFVSNKRQNGWTDRAQIFCGTSREPREGLWIIKISNICLYQNSIVIKFFKIVKIREIFCENPRIIFILFYGVHKENMFRTNLEDGREAPSTASNIKMPIISEHSLCPEIKVAARTNNTKWIGSDTWYYRNCFASSVYKAGRVKNYQKI